MQGKNFHSKRQLMLRRAWRDLLSIPRRRHYKSATFLENQEHQWSRHCACSASLAKMLRGKGETVADHDQTRPWMHDTVNGLSQFNWTSCYSHHPVIMRPSTPEHKWFACTFQQGLQLLHSDFSFATLVRTSNSGQWSYKLSLRLAEHETPSKSHCCEWCFLRNCTFTTNFIRS